MRLPIDTSRLQFLVVAAAEPLKKFEDGKPRDAWAPRVDENGEILWRVQVVALGNGAWQAAWQLPLENSPDWGAFPPRETRRPCCARRMRWPQSHTRNRRR